MRLHAALTVLLAGACHGALLPRAQVAGRRTSPALGRREATSCGLAAALVSIALPSASWASGGATSGKTTSIPRAKLRYYDRITAVVTSYQGLEKSIAAGNTKNSPFWAGDQPPYDELKTAGYLLAVAFKIDSKIPPDKLQTVKDYKALIKDMDKLKSAMNSGKVADAATAYKASRNTFNVYLEGVELPPLGDARYEA